MSAHAAGNFQLAQAFAREAEIADQVQNFVPHQLIGVAQLV